MQSYTHDDQGHRAAGALFKLDEFRTYIGFKLSHLIFGETEEVSHLLQSKKTTVYVTRLYNKCKFRNVFFCGSTVKRLSVSSTTN